MNQPQLALTPITVHCFACPVTVEAFDPITAHDLMEQHYAADHAALIAVLAGDTARHGS